MHCEISAKLAMTNTMPKDNISAKIYKKIFLLKLRIRKTHINNFHTKRLTDQRYAKSNNNEGIKYNPYRTMQIAIIFTAFQKTRNKFRI